MPAGDEKSEAGHWESIGNLATKGRGVNTIQKGGGGKNGLSKE